MNFFVWDQDVMIDDSVGTLSIPIDDILFHNPPFHDGQPTKFQVLSKSRHAGDLVLSFKAGDDYSGNRKLPPGARVHDQSDYVANRSQYGTFYFNTRVHAD